MMKQIGLKLFVVLMTIAIGMSIGCSSKKEEYGSKKEDYVPGEPPKGWVGPGDANAPGAKGPSGPKQSTESGK